MLKMNRKMEYALMVLHYFWEHNSERFTQQTPVSVKFIAEHFGLPFDTASKVMQSLANFGILRAKQGVKGGYVLQGDLGQWSLIDVAEAIDEKKALVDCVEKQCALEKSCSVHGPLRRLHQYLHGVFDTIQLDVLFSKDFPVESTRIESKQGA